MERLIFCDIDGCLGPGKHLPLELERLAEVRRLVKELAASGTGFCLCTGRPQPYGEAMAQVLDVYTPFVCENGAMVFEPEFDRATPLATPEDNQALAALRAALVPEGLIFEVGNDFSLSLSWEGIGRAPHADILARREALAAKYERFGLSWTNSHTSIDITPRGISKQSGMVHILAKFGLGAAETIAIGDSHNDLKMLSFAAHPMCPANANPEVKAICKTIASQPQVAGVVELLNGLLLR